MASTQGEQNDTRDDEKLGDHGETNVDRRVTLVGVLGFHEAGQQEVDYTIGKDCNGREGYARHGCPT